MFKKGEYIRVNERILTNDQYYPPRTNLKDRYGIIEKEDKTYPSVQLYRWGQKDPSLPMKIPVICLEKVTEWEFRINRLG
jgi:hypothetical protein